MAIVFYIIGSIAAVLLIAAAVRALVLMDRMEQTRKDLATLLSEGSLTLQHANRMLTRMQESVERMRHAVEQLEKVLALLQPVNAVGGILAGARRVFGGGHQQKTEPAEGAEKETNHG